jgi:hypothetical protein
MPSQTSSAFGFNPVSERQWCEMIVHLHASKPRLFKRAKQSWVSVIVSILEATFGAYTMDTVLYFVKNSGAGSEQQQHGSTKSSTFHDIIKGHRLSNRNSDSTVWNKTIKKTKTKLDLAHVRTHAEKCIRVLPNHILVRSWCFLFEFSTNFQV